MIFKTIAGVEYQMDPDDALNFVGISITMRSNGYMGIQSHDWPGDSYIHRQILQALPHEYVDHINGDKLDNRRQNLRICTARQNAFNSGIRSNNSSGVRGVYWDSSRLKWCVQIKAGEKRLNLGRFDDFAKACEVRAKAERQYHGEHAAIDGVLSEKTK